MYFDSPTGNHPDDDRFYSGYLTLTIFLKFFSVWHKTVPDIGSSSDESNVGKNLSPIDATNTRKYSLTREQYSKPCQNPAKPR